MNTVLFRVETKLGFPVKTTHGCWKVITTIKHPSMTGRIKQVKRCLSQPDEVRLSRKDEKVYLFYKWYKSRYVCVVVKREGNWGFIVTSYLTEKIKEGETIWKK